MLWSLGNEGTIPKIISKTNKNGIPVIALCLSMIGGLLALLSSIFAADTIGETNIPEITSVAENVMGNDFPENNIPF